MFGTIREAEGSAPGLQATERAWLTRSSCKVIVAAIRSELLRRSPSRSAAALRADGRWATMSVPPSGGVGVRKLLALISGALIALFASAPLAGAITGGEPDGSNHPEVGALVGYFPPAGRSIAYCRARSSRPPSS